MQESDLELYTTRQLIDELMRRQTFFGVVVHSVDDHKRPEWGDERLFKVHFNSNLDAPRASRLLDAVAEYMDLQVSEEE
jgi:hypothetical protein